MVLPSIGVFMASLVSLRWSWFVLIPKISKLDLTSFTNVIIMGNTSHNPFKVTNSLFLTLDILRRGDNEWQNYDQA